VRGETFVTRKITRGLARIKAGLQESLFMGNLDSLRDWGHARDYAEMQWLMLQQEQPEDFVIATGEQHSVREFINLAAAKLEITLRWQGSGVDEKACDERDRCIVAIDPRYFRPTEVDNLLGNPAKAKAKLGWEPKTGFDQLVTEMVEADYELAKRDALVRDRGYKIHNHHE
jgi:GDPmannose 4,6-dehydratase